MASSPSIVVWDFEGFHAISARHVQLFREVGALAQLLIPLSSLAIARSGRDFAGAAALVAEIDSVMDATGSRFAPYALLRLRALQGREAEASALIASEIGQAAAGGQDGDLCALCGRGPVQRLCPL